MIHAKKGRHKESAKRNDGEKKEQAVIFNLACFNEGTRQKLTDREADTQTHKRKP